MQNARKLTQLRDAAKYIEDDNHELDQFRNAIHREISRRLYQNPEFTRPYENVAQGELDPEYDKLIDMIWESYNDYKKKHQAGRKKLQKAYDDIQKNANAQDWQIQKAKDELDKYDSTPEMSHQDYVDQYLNHIYSSRFVLTSEDMLQRLKDRKTLLEEISKELGIDVSTSRLGSMIKSIENTKDEMLKLFDDDMSKVMNEAIKELNSKAKKG